MHIPSRNILIVLLLLFFFFTGCSTTKVTDTWKNSGFTGKPFTSILVVGLIKDPDNKLYWEKVMATVLRDDGFEKVITTLNAFPTNQEQVDKEKIIAYINNNNIEGVLVTRLVDVKKETITHPSYGNYYSGRYTHYNNFGSYYNRGYSRVYMTTSTDVLLETNLYQANNQELIWSMSSETNKTGTIPDLIKSVSKKVLATLKNDHLIQK